jgi:alpha 1,2-mannosyltransferase
MGDKDTWRYAFKALDLPVPWTTRTFSPAGSYRDRYGKPSSEFCGHTMLQWGLTPTGPEADQLGWHPEPGFAHGTMLKFHQAPDGSDTTEPLVFTHVQRPARDLLLEEDIDDTHFGFNWEPRHCFTLQGPQVLTIPFDETFRAGRDADVRGIQRAALRFVSVEEERPI